MVGFDRHLRYGVGVYAASVALTGVAYVAGTVTVGTVALVVSTLPLTLAGAMFPDLDHPSSLPYRYGKRYLPLLFAVIAMVVGVRHHGVIATVLAPEATGTGAFLSGVAVASMGWGTFTGTRWLFPRLRPPHRTVTHRLSTGLITALCVGTIVALLMGEPAPAGLVAELIASGAFFAGFASHLAADGAFPSLRMLSLGAVNDE